MVLTMWESRQLNSSPTSAARAARPSFMATTWASLIPLMRVR